jgi:hypothetical protein
MQLNEVSQLRGVGALGPKTTTEMLKGASANKGHSNPKTTVLNHERNPTELNRSVGPADHGRPKGWETLGLLNA